MTLSALAGGERHVKGVEHHAGLEVGREGHAAPRDRVISLLWTPRQAKPEKVIHEAIAATEGTTTAAPHQQQANRERLIKAIVKARAWLDDLSTGRVESVDGIAMREGKSARNIRMMVKLAFLDPSIVEAVVEEATARHHRRDRDRARSADGLDRAARGARRLNRPALKARQKLQPPKTIATKLGLPGLAVVRDRYPLPPKDRTVLGGDRTSLDHHGLDIRLRASRMAAWEATPDALNGVSRAPQCQKARLTHQNVERNPKGRTAAC